MMTCAVKWLTENTNMTFNKLINQLHRVEEVYESFIRC